MRKSHLAQRATKGGRNSGCHGSAQFAAPCLVAACLAAMLLAACTVHPAGETEERRALDHAGAIYQHPVETRTLPALSAAPTPDELVTYALLASADLEQKYWQWQSAIEQIPQEATQKANLALSYTAMITSGASALANNALAAGSNPMSNLVLPSKLQNAAQIALENARAAGLRFEQARFGLRADVLSAYYDCALSAQMIRLEEANAHLLEMIAQVTQARVSTNLSMQQDILRAASELELSHNELAAQKAKLAVQLAQLNRLLNRDPAAAITPPAALPPAHPLAQTDEQILTAAAQNNAELRALAAEIRGKNDAISLAQKEYLPDFAISGGTDLAGVAQSLIASVSLPYLRHEAIDAGIRQAQANTRAADAMLRQSRTNLAARIVADLVLLRDADRQIALYQSTILPRADRIITAVQNSYSANRATLLDLLDSQRSLIALRRFIAQLQVEREKELADLESACSAPLADIAKQ